MEDHLDEATGTTNGYSGAERPEETSQRPAEIRSEIAHLDRRARRFVQERPLTAVLCGVAGGYLLARLAKRL